MKFQKAGLSRVISELKKRGEVTLAQELEKDLGTEGAEIPEMEAAEMPTEEMPADIELEKAVASVKSLLKHGIKGTIVKTASGYAVKAADEVSEEEIAEEIMDEAQPEIVDEATAEIIVRANMKKGLQTRVTRVESGFVVSTLAETMEQPMEEMLEEAAEATEELPIEAVQYEEELAEEAPVTEEQAQVAIAKLHALGKNAKVTRTKAGFVVKAEDETIPTEEAAEEVLPEILDEEAAEAAIAAIHAAGQNAQVVRVESGFVVTAEEIKIEEMAAEMPEQIADEAEKLAAEMDTAIEESEEEQEPEILDEAQAHIAIAALNAQGKDAAVVKVIGGFVVTAADEEMIAIEDAEESPAEVSDEIQEIKQDAIEDSEDVVDALSSSEEIEEVQQPSEVKEELKEFDGIEEEKIAAAEEEFKTEEQIAEEAVEPKEDEMTPLASVESLGEITQDDVTMLLQADASNEPFYNVIIKGMPVANISLANQPKPEQIAEYFGSENYAMDIIDAMLKMGVKKTLSNVNAKFYANEVVKANLKEAVTAEIEDKYNRQYAEAVATVRDDLADRIAMVIAGTHKNFFKDSTNHLKVALYDAIEAELDGTDGRLTETRIVNAIEAGFERGAAPLFGTILDKAVGYLDTSKEALADIKKAIGEANIQPLEYSEEEAAEEETEVEQAQTYARLLTSKNVPVTSRK